MMSLVEEGLAALEEFLGTLYPDLPLGEESH